MGVDDIVFRLQKSTFTQHIGVGREEVLGLVMHSLLH